MGSLTGQNSCKNVQGTSLAQEQNYMAPASFKGTEAAKSVLQAQENMRVPKSVMGVVSFKGNPAKKNNQIASIASEYQGLPKEFNTMYKIGGLSNVAGEAACAFKKEGMDIRTFIPYYSRYTNGKEMIKADGGIFVHSTKNGEDVFKVVNNPATYELEEGEDFALVAGEYRTEYNSDKKEKEVVSQPTWMKLNRTNISGSTPYLDEVDKLLTQKDDKYTLFELVQKEEGGEEKPKVYVVHTEGLAKLTKAYGGDEGDAYFSNYDREYANFARAVVGEILPKMSESEENKETFGDYNPAGYWLHDRFAFPAMLEASKRAADGDEYFSGLRMHATYHNPGRGYQGYYDNPLDFIKTIGAIEILDTLAQEKPEEAKRVADYIEKIKIHKLQKGHEVDSVKDSLDAIEEKENKGKTEGTYYKDLEKIFEPYVGQFKDELGTYNMSLIPHVAKEVNGENFTHGTVSMNYGKEMINSATPEIALGLTSILKEDEFNMVNITNGSSAVNLGLDRAEFNGAPGLDKLAKAEDGYRPLVRDEIKTAEQLNEIKKSNSKWAINAVSEGFRQANEIGEKEGITAREDALKEFFFKDNKEASSILGSMSPYQEGDKLFFGWGRGDEQKGIPTTLEAFKQFYSDENIPEERKMHTKLILGAGVWKEDSEDWKKIVRLMDEIAKIDDGKYANNVMYVNGRIPNKLAACADFTVLTSRYEPCGITPLESYSAGAPVISVATGGAPNFVKHGETGYLTRHAFYTEPETLEKETGIEMTGNKTNLRDIDNYRIQVLGAETKDCISEALDLDNEKYKEMAFECFMQKVGWDENSEYNNGTSANDRYFTEAFGVEKTENGFAEVDETAHSTAQMKAVTGDIKPKAKEGGREDLAFEDLKKGTIKEVKSDKTEEVKPTKPEEVNPIKPEGEKAEEKEIKKEISTGKKVATGAGIAAAIVALGVAIKKLFGGKDKKAKKVSGKTPKAPKPNTQAAKTTAPKAKTPTVSTEGKTQTKDFSKYLK